MEHQTQMSEQVRRKLKVAMQENARLQAEVESLMTSPTSRLLRAEREEVARLKALTVEMDKTINASQAECRRLKAEVERLTEVIKAQAKGLDEKFGREGGQPSLSDSPTWQAIGAYAELKEENARLKAEVEHLTSENLLVREEADRYCRLWQEAKEGKQP
jgi:hypothetical protein